LLHAVRIHVVEKWEQKLTSGTWAFALGWASWGGNCGSGVGGGGGSSEFLGDGKATEENGVSSKNLAVAEYVYAKEEKKNWDGDGMEWNGGGVAYARAKKIVRIITIFAVVVGLDWNE
jgi:hypothetical protein